MASAARRLLSLTGGAMALYGLVRVAQRRREAPLLLDSIDVSRSITIEAPQDVVYRRWRSFAELPKVMKHIDEIEVIDDKRQRWRADLLAHGAPIEWVAEITDDVPNERIAWRSVEGGPVDMQGEVRFTATEDGRATRLDVAIDYKLRVGKLGAAVGRGLRPLLRDEVKEDLRRFQSLLETGELPTTLGQPAGAGRREGITRLDKLGGAS